MERACQGRDEPVLPLCPLALPVLADDEPAALAPEVPGAPEESDDPAPDVRPPVVEEPACRLLPL